MARFFSSFHNPKSKWYARYYSAVLVAVIVVVVFTVFQVIHQNLLQNTATFFEGFFSLFMLSRNENVGKAFLSHLSGINVFIKS